MRTLDIRGPSQQCVESFCLYSVMFFCIAALRRGLDVQSDVINLISHACEERMRHLTEKVSLVAEHRLDIHKVIACGLSNNNFSIIIKHY
mgnify:CR=1 FL=1